MSTRRPVLEVENLAKSFNGNVAVAGISFSLASAEILGLLGPNGAGKTTTIQMLLGLVSPSAGHIRYFGLDFPAHREEILARINFSSTYVSLPYFLTAWENLVVYAKLYNVKHHKEKIAEVLDTFEIYDLRKNLTRNFSSGQLTRLHLARALLNDPQVLLLDEPTASLDPDIADKTRTLLRRIRDRKGLSILYTSHNMKEMEEMSDRIIFLQRGSIIDGGTPRELLERYHEESLEDVFLQIARDNVPRPQASPRTS